MGAGIQSWSVGKRAPNCWLNSVRATLLPNFLLASDATVSGHLFLNYSQVYLKTGKIFQKEPAGAENKGEKSVYNKNWGQGELN